MNDLEWDHPSAGAVATEAHADRAALLSATTEIRLYLEHTFRAIDDDGYMFCTYCGGPWDQHRVNECAIGPIHNLVTPAGPAREGDGA